MHAHRTYTCVCVCINVHINMLGRFENSKFEFGIGKTEVHHQITRNIRSEWCDPYCDPTAKIIQISDKQFYRFGPVVCSFTVQLFLVNFCFFSLPNFLILDALQSRTLSLTSSTCTHCVFLVNFCFLSKSSI
jgi:hypothetical protein